MHVEHKEPEDRFIAPPSTREARPNASRHEDLHFEYNESGDVSYSGHSVYKRSDPELEKHIEACYMLSRSI